MLDFNLPVLAKGITNLKWIELVFIFYAENNYVDDVTYI